MSLQYGWDAGVHDGNYGVLLSFPTRRDEKASCRDTQRRDSSLVPLNFLSPPKKIYQPSDPTYCLQVLLVTEGAYIFDVEACLFSLMLEKQGDSEHD